MRLIRAPLIKLIRPFIRHQQAANVAILAAVIDIGKTMHVFETDLDDDARDRAELLAEIRRTTLRDEELEARVAAEGSSEAATSLPQ